MSVDDAIWSEIRRCYCDGALSVARIAAHFDVSVGVIRYRAGRDGWKRTKGRVRRVTRRGSGEAEAVGKEDRARSGSRLRDERSVTREEVVERLYRAIVGKLVRLEERMETGEAMTASESERETRELSTMVRSFEKVTGVAAEIAKERKPKSGERDADNADAERMRREIAERLERLNAQWETESEPGDAE